MPFCYIISGAYEPPKGRRRTVQVPFYPNIKCAAATIINNVSLRAASDRLTKNFLIWKFFKSPSGVVYVWMLPHGYTQVVCFFAALWAAHKLLIICMCICIPCPDGLFQYELRTSPCTHSIKTTCAIVGLDTHS